MSRQNTTTRLIWVVWSCWTSKSSHRSTRPSSGVKPQTTSGHRRKNVKPYSIEHLRDDLRLKMYDGLPYNPSQIELERVLDITTRAVCVLTDIVIGLDERIDKQEMASYGVIYEDS